MANGQRTHPGAIAVDPEVIPLGSKIYVPGYGWGVADDTGSDIRGYHIDVWISNCHDAYRATQYDLKVYVQT